MTYFKNIKNLNDPKLLSSSIRSVKQMHNNLSFVLVFSLSFFQDGLKTADKLKQYIEKLAADLYNVSKPLHLCFFRSVL